MLHPVPGCRVFLSGSDVKSQWAEVFGLLVLVAGLVAISAVLHVFGVFPWHCFLALSVLLDRLPINTWVSFG